MKTVLWLLIIAFSSASAHGQGQPAPLPFAIAIRTDQMSFKAGSYIDLLIQLRNTSKEPLDLSANISDLTGIDPNYIYDIRDEHGTPVPKRIYPHPELATGHAVIRSLGPGEITEETEPISRLLDMSKPGKYSIEVSRSIPGGPHGAVVRSNKIFVVVTP